MNHPKPQSLSKYIQGEILHFELDKDYFNGNEAILASDISGKFKEYLFLESEKNLSLKIPIEKTGFFQWSIKHKPQKENEWKQANINDQEFSGEIQVDPSWITDAIVYSVFVRFFKGKIKEKVDRKPNIYKKEGIGEEELKTKTISSKESVLPGEGGTFDDVKDHLDVLKSMGINTLYFNPIHTIGDIYRGYNMLDQLPPYLQPGSPYSIKDYKSIDPELTYDKDTGKHLMSNPQQEFKDLIKAAHDRKMYVVMDLVFNHTAHDFVFQRIKPEWYLYKENINSLDDPYLYPEDLKQGKPWGDARHTFCPYDHGTWWEDCAQLNWEYKIPEGPNQPPPNSSLDEMYEYFKSIPKYWIKHFGVDGFRCDVAYRVPPDFWRQCIQESRSESRKDNNNLSGDVVFIAESYTSDLESLQQSGFTAVYGDYSHKLKTPETIKGYLDHIYNISDSAYPPGSKWFIFPDSHDFDRSPRKVLGEDLSEEKALLANQSRWLLSACVPGMPLIFNGFEKIEWEPINIWSYGAINWEKDIDLKRYISKVNHIRRRLVALQKGNYSYIHSNQGLSHDTQIFSFERKHRKHRVIVAINMDVHSQAGPTTLYLPEEYDREFTITDELTKEKYQREGREMIIKLDPGQSHIFTVKFN
ncbi:alpha-amylase family glycosyl hydrolase [Patescibacteria group bacterium]